MTGRSFKNFAALSLSACLVLTSSDILLANQAGTSTATFLRLGQGARAEGMGGAFTAVADDAYAVYWNPAGLAQISRVEVGLNHLQFIEKINSQFASVALPVNKINGTFGLGTTYVDYGTIERRDGVGNAIGGETKVDAYAGTLAYGQAVGERLALGVGAKFFQQNLAGEKGSGVAADLGAIVSLVPNRLNLGFAALNVGPKVKTGTTDENIPLTTTVGLAYYVVPGQFLVAVDGAKERDTDVILHVGGEYYFQHRFVLRGGYQDTKEAGGGISAGVGFIWQPKQEGGPDFFGGQDNKRVGGGGLQIRFDYSYVDLGDFDATHRIGVHFAF